VSALYIDADACPVKEEAERVATRHKLKMYVVSNGGLRPSRNPLVENIIVSEGADVADMWIAERCGTGDVVVTGDIPLAPATGDAGFDGRPARRQSAGGWRLWQGLYQGRPLAFSGRIGTRNPRGKVSTLSVRSSVTKAIFAPSGN
jgi:hypothetical protein